MDPYKTLRVPKTAKKPSIKKAYRKRAKETHPDAGGDAETFKNIVAAYKLLTDESRRERYDQTGDADEPKAAPVSGPMAILGAVFQGLMAKLFSEGVDPTERDLIAIMRESIQGGLNQNAANLKKVQVARKRVEKMLGRFTVVDAEDVFESLLRRELANAEQAVAAIETAVMAHKDALAMLKKFTFKFDKPTVESVWQMMGGTTTVSVRMG